MGFWKTLGVVVLGNLLVTAVNVTAGIAIKYKKDQLADRRARAEDTLREYERSPYGGPGKNEKGPKARMIGFGAND